MPPIRFEPGCLRTTALELETQQLQSRNPLWNYDYLYNYTFITVHDVDWCRDYCIFCRASHKPCCQEEFMLAAQVQTRLVLQGKLRLTQSRRNRPKSVIKSLKTDCCILVCPKIIKWVVFSASEARSHGIYEIFSPLVAQITVSTLFIWPAPCKNTDWYLHSFQHVAKRGFYMRKVEKTVFLRSFWNTHQKIA